jgi:heavy metal sensor kinase
MRELRILRSVRTRLALWHTGALALVLLAFTGATFAFLERLTTERVDRSLSEAVSAFHSAVLAHLHDDITPEEAALNAAREFRFSERRVLVYGDRHRLIAISDSSRDVLTAAISAIEEADDSPLHPIFASLIPGSAAYAMVGDGVQNVRGYARRVVVNDVALTIVALQTGLSERSLLATFLQAAAIAIPIALVLAGVGGYLLARRGLEPVVDMGRKAASIDSKHLGARLGTRQTGDELDELAAVFNDMLDRLERSFVQQKRFMADASHELRTPIASLRAAAGIALSQPRSNDEYERALMHVRDEARRLSLIVEDLFTLARLDDQGQQIHRESFFLEELVMGCVGSVRPLAHERGVRIEFTPDIEAHCTGDPLLLDRLITNLLDNAIKHTPTGGVVRVEVTQDDGACRVRVIDTGTGIPDEAKPHIFDRFFRAEAARTRPHRAESGGGLGLSIAWQIARAHGGELNLVRSDAQGTEFALVVPSRLSSGTVRSSSV